jgi:hypothetical protein
MHMERKAEMVRLYDKELTRIVAGVSAARPYRPYKAEVRHAVNPLKGPKRLGGIM